MNKNKKETTNDFRNILIIVGVLIIAGTISQIGCAGGDLANNISIYNNDIDINSKDCDWLYLCYVASDNNLGDPSSVVKSMSRNVIDLMEAIGSTNKVKSVVFFDEKYSDTKEYFIQKDNVYNKFKSIVTLDYGKNVDSGNVKYLTDFIVSNVNKYNPKKIVVDIWNHGSGAIFKNDNTDYRGICYDDSSRNNITLKQLKEGLASAQTTTGKKINILVLSACYMGGYETAYQVRDCADYCLFSPPVIYGKFMPDIKYDKEVDITSLPILPFQPYNKFLETMNKNNEPFTVLSNFLTSTYYEHVMKCYDFDSSFTIVDLKQMSSIQLKFIEFSGVFYKHYSDENHKDNIKNLIRISESYSEKDEKGTLYDNLKDLGSFLSLLMVNEKIPQDLKDSATSFKSVLDSNMVNISHNSKGSPHDWSKCTGISILLPTAYFPLSSEYLSYDFLIGNEGWYKYLINANRETLKKEQ